MGIRSSKKGTTFPFSLTPMQACHVAISLPFASPFQNNTLSRSITPDTATRCLPLRDQKRNTAPRQTNTLTDLATIRTQTARNTIRTTAPGIVPKFDLHPVPMHLHPIPQMLATTKGRRTNRQMRPNTALFPMKDRTNPQIMLVGSKAGLNLRQLTILDNQIPRVCQYRFKITPLFRLNNGPFPSKKWLLYLPWMVHTHHLLSVFSYVLFDLAVEGVETFWPWYVPYDPHPPPFLPKLWLFPSELGKDW